MEYGIVRQVGKPWEVYVQPEDAFITGFIGTTNMLDSEVKTSEEVTLLVVSYDAEPSKIWLVTLLIWQIGENENEDRRDWKTGFSV